MPSHSVALADECFDVIVIGAGVVGCAIARRFTLEGARVVVVEKAADILDGASKANSAILHTGFDAPPGSLEHACIREGYLEYQSIHRELGLPLERSGAYVVAWQDDEVERLEEILSQAHDNGIDDVTLIDAATLLKKEPNLAPSARAAISVPGESLIDPWSAPYAYLKQSLANGGQVLLSCEVTGGEFDGHRWRLETSRGVLNGRYVINSAGLYGDTLDQRLLGSTQFHITPRKGQFVVFDKAAADLVDAIILPVPTSRTKGVVVCRTVFGNLLVGPTAEDQESRSEALTDEVALRALIKSGVAKLPALRDMPVTATYAGLRPASEFKDYQIDAVARKNWITVGAIRSTGLSGALGIAHHIFRIYRGLGPSPRALSSPQRVSSPVLTEQGRRDWQCEGHGDIVCHCELVTEREIEAALTGPLAARSLAGLKRQTRVTMGRCQGFYCSARLAELTEDRFELPLAEKISRDS